MHLVISQPHRKAKLGFLGGGAVGGGGRDKIIKNHNFFLQSKGMCVSSPPVVPDILQIFDI